jgi:transcriptional regulator with XRE-family HTH domain
MISLEKALHVERTIDETIAQRRHLKSFGDKLRAARISAGYTLRQAAELIGYTWIAVERWEQNKCLPKPGVLWHLRSVYGVGEDWLPVSAPALLKQTA